MKQYLVVGNGVAGARAAVKIRETDSRGEIHIFTEEAYPFYYRVRFPDLIAGEVTIQEITIHSKAFYEARNISLHLGEPVIKVDPGKQEVQCKQGSSYPYDRLLMATGGNAFIPPIRGKEKEGVFTLRTMQDAIQMKAFSGKTHQAVLIGGGLVGLETGGALLRQGVKVVVIESNPRILPRQMDPEGSLILQAKLEEMGFSFFLNGHSEEILGNGKVEGVRLKDGRMAEGEMVIISAGVRPNVQLAKETGLETNQGMVVNDRLETKIKSIFAAGDAAEHRGRVYGIWPAAQRQGEIAGINMAGGDEVYQGTIVSNTLKVVGIDLTSAGEIDPEGKLECVVRSDREKCKYCKVTFKEDKVIGCILLGDITRKSELLNLIGKEGSLSEVKQFVLKEDAGSKRSG